MPEHTDAQLASIACAHLQLPALTAREVWQLTQAIQHYEQDGTLTLSDRWAIYHVIARFMETVEL